ncbi:hypothetical protein K2X05_15170 [bacterium]|nr:hypothetical protein [bacterium]
MIVDQILGGKIMKTFGFTLTVFAVLGMGSHAHAAMNLIAKCGFPLSNDEQIRPGAPFIYVLENNGKFFVINSIANTWEKISERSTGLAGDISPVEARITANKVERRVEWEQKDPGGANLSIQKNYIDLRILASELQSELDMTDGISSFTENRYPSCVVFD